MSNTDGEVTMKRVKRKVKASPNPLFESWLEEWKEEAKRNGSEMQYSIARALKSLRKFPFRLATGKECFILENFGTKICAMLDKKLNDHNSRQGSGVSVTNTASSIGTIAESITFETKNDDAEVSSKRKSCMNSPIRALKHPRNNNSKTSELKKKNYLPVVRSGGYAILLTLHKNSEKMSKAEIEVEAQSLCDAPFKKSSASYYTAWSSMATLIKKGLVEKFNGKPPRFGLTQSGVDAANELEFTSENKTNDLTDKLSSASEKKKPSDSVDDDYANFNISFSINLSNQESLQSTSLSHADTHVPKSTTTATPTELSAGTDKLHGFSSQTNEETIFLLPTEFDVVLYVDTQELENKQKIENDKIIKYLKGRNIKFEVKHLSVGDYLWVCRNSKTNQDLLLPYIVERKRIDDLAMSIKDGRFHEQKFRLKQCGLKNVIYLVEKFKSDGYRVGLPLPTIEQAISNTRVIDGFDLKITSSHDDSMSYLSTMTTFLTEIFKDKTLMSCRKKNLPEFNMSDDLISLMTFEDFNKDSGKMRKFTVRSMLVKHLIQLNGVSVEKAKAIVKAYPTPKFLIEALLGANGETVLAEITCGALKRSIGSTIAKSIYQLYTSSKLN